MEDPDVAGGRPPGEFTIIVDFPPRTDAPSAVFEAMASLIDAFQALDRDVARALGSGIEATVLLERVEAGSLRAWLSSQLRNLDDTDMRELNWRRLLGDALVRVKWAVLRWLERNEEIRDRPQLVELEREIHSITASATIHAMPQPRAIPLEAIVLDAKRVSDAVLSMPQGHSARVESAGDSIAIGRNARLTDETVESLLTEETIVSTTVQILQVKRPDFLGNSMWELKGPSGAISAKIEDATWLAMFQSRQVTVRPGDAIVAKVSSSVKYGRFGDVVGAKHAVTEVQRIIERNIDGPYLGHL
jgi:hypothetical protein